MISFDIYELGDLSTARTYDRVNNLEPVTIAFSLSNIFNKIFGQLAETPFYYQTHI